MKRESLRSNSEKIPSTNYEPLRKQGYGIKPEEKEDTRPGQSSIYLDIALGSTVATLWIGGIGYGTYKGIEALVIQASEKVPQIYQFASDLYNTLVNS